jgi:tetratricopeptide (TPR) repeat protein
MLLPSDCRCLAGRLSAVLAAALVLVGCGGAEARKASYLEKARALIVEEDYQKAQLEVRNALQIDPDDAAAYALSGQVAEKLGDPRAAVQMYRRALELDDTNLRARTDLARLYTFGGLPDEAMKLVEPGLAASPDNAGLLAVRSAAKVRLGDFAGAEADVRHALQSEPANENAIAMLAALFERQGKTVEAIELVEQGVKVLPKSVDLRLVLAQLYSSTERRPDARTLLTEIVALQPNVMAHRYRLARFHLAAKEVDNAERVLREAVRSSPDDIEPKKALVELLAAQRSFEAGEQEFLSLVAAAPRDHELRLALGDYYSASGRSAKADKVYQQLIDDDGVKPQGIAARNRLAASAMRANRVDDASRLVAEVIAENPQDNDALIMRADLALARGDTASAITDLRAVLRDQPSSVPVQRALARAYLQSNNPELAEETLKTAARDNPTDASLRLDLASVLARAGKPEQAEQALLDLVAESPQAIQAQEALFKIQAGKNDLVAARTTAQSVKSARPDLGLGDFLTGLVDRAEGKNEAAVRSYEDALKLQPDAAEPLTELVKLLLSQKRADQAIAKLDGVIKQQPTNALAHNLKGEILLSQKRTAEALTEFTQATSLSPGWWVPYRGQALANLAASRTEAAVESFQSGLKATNGAISLATDLAALYERIGRPEDAIKVYQSMLENNPQNDLVANNLAMLLVTHRSDAKSLEEARKLADRFAQSEVPAFLNTNGWVKFKSGQFNEAIPPLQRAADNAPESPEMRYQLAMAQYKAGKREDAKKNLEAALARGVKFAGMDDARATLDELRRS